MRGCINDRTFLSLAAAAAALFAADAYLDQANPRVGVGKQPPGMVRGLLTRQYSQPDGHCKRSAS